MNVSTPATWIDIIAQVLPLAQSLIAVILTYIAKLMRDMRKDLGELDKRLGQAEIMHGAQIKLTETVVHDMRREQDQLIRRIERLEEESRGKIK